MQAANPEEVPSLVEGQGSFAVAVSFMPSCSLPGPTAVPALPDILQAQIRPFKLAQTPLASIAEAVLCSCGFHADAVRLPLWSCLVC